MDYVFHVIVFQDNEVWLAQILEHDIVIQAERREDLRSEFCYVVMGRIKAAEQEVIEDPFDLPPAPTPHPEGERIKVEFRVENDAIHFTDGSSWRTI